MALSDGIRVSVPDSWAYNSHLNMVISRWLAFVALYHAVPKHWEVH